mgnify:FL=1
MVMCARCKKNMAVVFVTRVENGKTKSEGLCLKCARELGVDLSKSMEAMGVSPEEIDKFEEQMAEIMAMPENGDYDLDDDDYDNPVKSFFKLMGPDGEEKPKKDKKGGKKRRLLDSYGTNLTKKAAAGEVDAVIGRDDEITRCIEILNRRTKNNPCLIGEPGVGKTAIAEGLAMRIAAGTVPEKLLDYEVYLLDFTSIVAGTQFRGQFESRLKGILDEVKKAGNIILVIDELHNIVGAGEGDGAMSAANILKPALARGEIQVIGATTTTEYRKYIEKDSALERRFGPILIEEPTVEEAIDIIRGIKGYYEDYHKVSIPDSVVSAAVKLSERYITDRFLPDKAIDVIDEAASKANLKNTVLIKLAKLQCEMNEVSDSLDKLQEAPENDENFREAAELRTKRCRISEDIKKLEAEKKDVCITEDDVAFVIERWTKIPAAKISMDENKRLLELPQTLRKRVKGQDNAIDAVSAAILRSRVGLEKKRRPVSFIFTGSTGVGKTELVLSLAEAVFGSEEALIRLDMSEYMEKHSAAKIIGSPPGYVGYDDAGQLTEKVRRKPYSIILFDEIEKAHADVANILLQILDDGKITDSHGKSVDFSNTMIVMTSNAGSDFKGNAPGFTRDDRMASADKVTAALREQFRPEFLNRIDEIITFNPLNHDVLLEILDKMLSEFSEMLLRRDIKFKISDEAREFILKRGTDIKNGARPLRRAIQKELEDKAARMIVTGEIKPYETLCVDAEEEKLLFSVSK